MCKYQNWHDIILRNSTNAENKIELPKPIHAEIVQPIHRALIAGVKPMKFCIPAAQSDGNGSPKGFWEYVYNEDNRINNKLILHQSK